MPDNNSIERTIRPIALNRNNALFAGHDAGAENWAIIASLIETCKLNAVDPLAYLTATLTAIVSGHKQSQIDELLPWNCSASTECHNDFTCSFNADQLKPLGEHKRRIRQNQ